jgi:hypothetical protein
MQGDEQRSYTAVVDSGASTSAFPLEVALALGMARDELDLDPRGAYGLVPGDSGIPTYRSGRFTVTAQVMADIDGYNAEPFGRQPFSSRCLSMAPTASYSDVPISSRRSQSASLTQILDC